MKINVIDLILIKDTDFTSLIFENIGDMDEDDFIIKVLKQFGR
jgi:hypothetical protein